MCAQYSPDIEAILTKPTASVAELARVLGVGRDNAYDLVNSGKVRSIRVGRVHKVPTVAIRHLLEGTDDAA